MHRIVPKPFTVALSEHSFSWRSLGELLRSFRRLMQGSPMDKWTMAGTASANSAIQVRIEIDSGVYTQLAVLF
jgi:hypothetical protein